MKTTVYLNDFISAFHAAGRGDQFSRAALVVLFDDIEQTEQDTGSEIELDVVGICCEYAEDLPEDVAEAYNIEGDVVEYLEFEGAYIGTTNSGSIVYRQV